MIALVWTYSSGLEKESSRFSQPGDFFTYIVFLGLVILVRSKSLFVSNLSTHSVHYCYGYPFVFYKPHISARPAII